MFSCKRKLQITRKPLGFALLIHNFCYVVNTSESVLEFLKFWCQNFCHKFWYMRISDILMFPNTDTLEFSLGFLMFQNFQYVRISEILLSEFVKFWWVKISEISDVSEVKSSDMLTFLICWKFQCIGNLKIKVWCNFHGKFQYAGTSENNKCQNFPL